jgi:endonuclease/exonuclease/phosphatase family metal-dependent hydrolase
MQIDRSFRFGVVGLWAVLLAACAPGWDEELDDDDDTAEAENAIKDDVRFDVITHNIAGGMANEGRPEALNKVEREIAEDRPHVVMLQEVCQSQAEAFIANHPDWGIAYSITRWSHPKCAPGGAPLGQILASPHGLAKVEETDLGYADPGKAVTLLCGNVKLPNRKGSVRACTTHLVARNPDDPAESDHRRTLEVEKLVATLKPYVKDGKAVVVAGDFNSGPKKPVLDAIYRLKRDGTWGGGLFDEADQTDPRREEFADKGIKCAPGACRSGQPTHGESKIDHVFFSNNRISGPIEGRVRGPGKSDHHLYRGSAVLHLPAKK